MIDINAPAAPPMDYPNPYNYPAVIIVERIANGVVTNTETHEFTDLQQAWYWARNETGVDDFPFNEHPYGDHAGWEYMSFPFTKQEMEAHPEDDYEIFTKTNADGTKINYVIGYKEDEDEDEEDEEDVPPPAGSPGLQQEVFGPATNFLPPVPWGIAPSSIPLESISSMFAISAEDCFAAVGLNPHSTCPHGLPSYACMPCSH